MAWRIYHFAFDIVDTHLKGEYKNIHDALDLALDKYRADKNLIDMLGSSYLIFSNESAKTIANHITQTLDTENVKTSKFRYYISEIAENRHQNCLSPDDDEIFLQWVSVMVASLSGK